MKLTPQQRANLTPLAQWLLSYTREHDTTLTEVSRQAGLSLGTLRSLVLYPNRVPKLESCLQLARVTGEPADKIIGLAGLRTTTAAGQLDPDRISLLRAYDGLADPHLRRALTEIGQLLLQHAQA